MMTRPKSIFERLPRSFLLATVILGVLTGCGSDDTGQVDENNPPLVQFTAGPTRLEQTDGYYSTEVRWMGWDFDGEIDHFQYALDPNPDADPANSFFTQEEINFPEENLGPPVSVARGPTDASDTLYYGKLDSTGTMRTFSWIQTREFSAIINLSTLEADGDTSQVGANETFRYKGTHNLYLRAIDNEDKISEMDVLTTDVTEPEAGFVVLNVVPETEIVVPTTSTGAVNGSNQFTVEWNGFDPDTRNPDKLPEGYLWKLVELPIEWEPGFINPNAIMYRHEDFRDIPWNYIDGDTTSVTVILEGGKKYLFSLRAVDEAGATEAHLTFVRGSETGGNTLFIQVNNAARPELSVTEPTLGTVVAQGLKIDDFEVPLGTCLRFEWEADAEFYGGQVAVTNYGLNVPDLDRHGPGSGWNGWREYDKDYVDQNGPYKTLGPICLDKPGVQTFYVKARDLSGASSIVAFVLNVVEFQFEYPILYVDDWSNFSSSHTDAFQERFWLDKFINSGRFPDETLTPALAKFDCWGDPEIALAGDPVPLEIMGNYRLLFWELRSGSYIQSGMSQSGPELLHVGAFLRVGGQVMYNGIQTIAHCLGDQSGGLAVGYPFDLTQEIRRGVNSFPYEFFNMFTSGGGNCIRNGTSSNDSSRETMLFVQPLPGRSNLPPMYIDSERTNLAFQNGLNWDFIQDPISEPGWFTGQIDSLYTGHTVGTHLNDRRSSLDNRVAALRVSYEPGDPNPRAGGRFAWFGFPLFYIQDDQLQDMMNAMFDWFLEEAPYEPGL